jgi:protein TonB
MFDRMPCSSLSLSVALTGHLAGALVLLGASYLIVEQVRDPDPTPTVFVRELSVVFDRTGTSPPRREGGPPGKSASQFASAPEKRREMPRPRIDETPVVAPDVPPSDATREVLDLIPGNLGGGFSGDGPPGRDGDGGGGNREGPGGPGEGEDRGVSTPLLVTGDVEPPVLLHKVEPVYPEIARKARLQGRVFLRAVIGTTGAVEAVEVLSTSPFFEDAAVAAVKEWRYRPARYHGAPVAVYFTVTVSFVLH